MEVRRAVKTDAAAMSELSREAILRSASDYYTAEQLAAWARRRTVDAHEQMIRETLALVAVDDEAVVGFATVALTPVRTLAVGEVDQLYVHPGLTGRGVARKLLDAVEAAARDAGLKELVTHASWRAAAVFERAGFQQSEVESVDVEGQTLTRALMRKALSPRGPA